MIKVIIGFALIKKADVKCILISFLRFNDLHDFYIYRESNKL